MPGIQNSTGTLSFLDGLGDNDRGDNVKLSHVAKALVELADHLVVEARNNLDKNGNEATGGTASSIKAGPLQTNATKMQIDISVASTYKFLNDGVRGVKSGTGKYQFKTIKPSAKMAKAIRAWLRVRKVATKYKAISKTERKNQRIKKLVNSADGKLNALSYAIATNIKKKGIKPTKFFTKAVDSTKRLRKEKFAAALKLDIIESFN